jgi:chemotaxis-related protein WspD
MTDELRDDSSCHPLATLEADPGRAREFFDRPPAAGYLDEWARRLRDEDDRGDSHLLSVVVFRLGAEHLAVESRRLVEVTPPVPVHALPHRSDGVLLGMVNIRGQLRICVSARRLLGVDDAPPDPAAAKLERFVILQDRADQWVFPVDHVLGVLRLAHTALGEVPATFGKASSFSRAVFPWGDHTVGLLDEARLLPALRSACA